MATITVPRGNYVVITTTFFDAQGNKVAPAATPVVTFAWAGATSVQANMAATSDPAIWTLQWDTSVVSGVSHADYSVRALASTGFWLVDNGTISLGVNLANR